MKTKCGRQSWKPSLGRQTSPTNIVWLEHFQMNENECAAETSFKEPGKYIYLYKLGGVEYHIYEFFIQTDKKTMSIFIVNLLAS